ncbi:MAG: peptidase M48 [Gammaproteobacteria bacterium]|nr:MAG: peptidase M48 [Gammaproteobacteria bacterium]
MRANKLVAGTLLLAALAPWPAQAFDLNLDLNKLRDVVTQQLKPMSEKDEIQLGRGIAANLLGAAPLVPDAQLQAYVNRLGKWLAMHTDRPALPWHFGVLDTESVNAFATPGGYVFITRGLLLQMRDEAELAGVLAHEISHVVEKHALETMKKGAFLEFAGDTLSQALRSEGSAEFSKIVSAGTEVFARGLDKQDEFAADRMGVVIAARAGYDAYGLPGTLQTLAAINPKDDAVALMFKTHPDPAERLELLLTAMEGKLEQYGDQPKVADRFASVMKSHMARYQPKKK